MLNGFDCSGWNKKEEVEEAAKSSDFVFIKASEGRTWDEVRAATLVNVAVEANPNIKIGFYHYCRPDNGNSYSSEMENFLTSVESTLACSKYTGKVALALDWEGDSIGHNNWLKCAVNYLSEETGVNPILYVSEAYARKAGDSLDRNRVGLWLASWGTATGALDKCGWPVVAFHQWTNKPYDKDVFNGDKEQLDKYFQYKDRAEEDNSCCDCHCCCGGGK